ncbi:MAG: DUF6879 family protein [Streptosporangiaceae bacterium]
MAATNADDGASLLAGIPGLTRTHGPGEKEPPFAELLAACVSSAVHLEIHDAHITSDPGYQAWLAGQGDLQQCVQQSRAYTDVVASAARRGVAVRRARIVSEPVSDYVRWEHWLTGPINITAGETVRWLPRRLASTLAIPGNPFWVFDNHLVRFTIFGGDGEVLGSQYSDAPAVIQACASAFEAIWELAIPHQEFPV